MLLSVVIPVFNEAEVLPKLIPVLKHVLRQVDCDHELIFVNDGSRDDTLTVLQQVAAQDGSIKVISFTRNFGHQVAVTAGLDFAEGDAVVVMDADLQDPPQILPQMLAKYREGFDVVSAQRVRRDGDGWFKRFTAHGFYWLMQKLVDRRIVPEVGDFRLFSRSAVLAIRSLREQHRFMRGLVAWLGMKETIVPFERGKRAAGETKYPLWKMLRFAWTAITSFSGLPLRLSLFIGALLTLFGMIYTGYVLYVTLVLGSTVPGWASLACLQTLFSGAVLMGLGLIGDYVARLYDEAKSRPLYVIGEGINLAPHCLEVPRTIWLQRREPHLNRLPPNGSEVYLFEKEYNFE